MKCSHGRTKPRRTADRAALIASPVFLVLLLACHPSRQSTRQAAQPSEPSLAAAQLQRNIDALIGTPELAHGYWGILVKSLKTGEALYSHDSSKLLVPASNMKILTTAVTAARLGWDYEYRTDLFAAGRMTDGVLDGDLVVVGTGDPQISGATLDLIADKLKASGLRVVTGRLVADARHFADEPLGFGWSWTDLADDYAAGVTALQVDEDTIRVTVTPAKWGGNVAAMETTPPYPFIDIGVTTGATGSSTEIESRRSPDRERIELRGTIAQDSNPVVLPLSVGRPASYFAWRLRTAIIDHGIDVRGSAQALEAGPDRSGSGERRLLLSYRSPPLATLATRLMKVSQNLYADTFLKSMGAESRQPTWEGGRVAIRETLAAWGVPPSDAVVVDGSGLSRYNFVTAEAIVKVLAHVYDDPKLRDPFLATMPLAGRDGSLERRMKGTVAEGNVRGKTGSMTKVRCVSGYATTADGEPLVFSILANNYSVASEVIDRTSDAIMVALASFARGR